MAVETLGSKLLPLFLEPSMIMNFSSRIYEIFILSSALQCFEFSGSGTVVDSVFIMITRISRK